MGNRLESHGLKDRLEDIGLSGKTVTDVLEAVQAGDKRKARLILNQSRKEVLREVHDSQDRLYRLDYMIREIGQEAL